MADILQRPKFKVKFPCVQLRPEYGGAYMLVLFSGKPRGDTSDIVLASGIGIDGRPFANIPIALGAIKHASTNPITLVEVDDTGIVAPTGGIFDLTGKRTV